MDAPSRDDDSGIVLRRGSGLPVYVQVVDQLRYLIAAGRYRVGDYLPPMRRIADELGLNLNTVHRAYGELQRDGLIRSTRGKGAVVVRPDAIRPEPAASAAQDQPTSVDAMLAAAVERALSSGLSEADVLDRTRAAIAAVSERAPSGPSVAVFAPIPWRARELADALRSAGVRRVRPVTNAEDASGADLVVVPRFGAGDPGGIPVGAPTIDIGLLLDRGFVRDLLTIEPGQPVAVVAGDDRAATWLADAVSGYAGAARVRRIVAASVGDADVVDERILVVEQGMPRGAGAAAGIRLLVAGAVFPASILESIEAASAGR